jgi:formylglycine-generating enzyme required for sulfatase activity
MGDELDGGGDAHRVRVSAFYMAQNLVTKAEWDEVRTWGLENGYSELVAGSGKADNHPVQTISWYQMVKWCNARSQKEGLVPVYYTDDAQTTVYKTGDVNVTNAQVKWSANGYRLPTEAEWEKAARGGKSGKRFPWGDTISHKQANYKSGSGKAYDLSGAVNGPHPSYTAGGDPCTSPVGSFAANGYGLYDMAGNVWQRCWDWYGSYDPSVLTDPRGPVVLMDPRGQAASGSVRVLRGASWIFDASYCRVAYRGFNDPSVSNDSGVGFRVARSSEP